MREPDEAAHSRGRQRVKKVVGWSLSALVVPIGLNLTMGARLAIDETVKGQIIVRSDFTRNETYVPVTFRFAVTNYSFAFGYIGEPKIRPMGTKKFPELELLYVEPRRIRPFGKEVVDFAFRMKVDDVRDQLGYMLEAEDIDGKAIGMVSFETRFHKRRPAQTVIGAEHIEPPRGD